MQTPLTLMAPGKADLAMIDHFVDAAIYLHEALVDGYDVEPKFLQPAREIRDLLWPKFGRTKLSFVLDDAAAAIGQAQAARSESEIKAALAKLVEAIRPWMMEGAPNHYAEKKVGFFKEEASGRQWVQRNARPVNPFGNRAASQLPWPNGAAASKGPAVTPSSPPAPPVSYGVHAAPIHKNGG